MKDKIKKFTEQISGLNESFVSFITKSIKEDIVFDISLNIGQYQDKRKEIEKQYDDVIKYLTNNKNALKPENKSFNTSTTTTKTTSKPLFSFSKPTETTTKETKPFTFGIGSSTTTTTTTTSTTAKPAFTFNLNNSTSTADKPASTTPTFSFGKSDTKSTTTTTTTAPTFSFNKQDGNKPTTPIFSFNNKDKTAATTTTATTTSSAPIFSFNSKPEDKKDDATTTKPTVPTFKPFTFNFGQKMANSSAEDQGKTLPKPNFSFGVAPPSKAEIAAAAAANDDDEEDQTEQVQLTTGAGEEDEDTVFEVKAKVHHYSMEEKKYISRGVGLLKVNKNKKTGKARLLGRMDNGSVFLNVSLFKEMVVSEPVNANQFTFNAMDRLEGSDEVKMIRFAVRVKDKENAKKLYDAIIENKN
ncbi:hypothetical protein PIROE2DRAFT_66934 [Piromyces sp. E2]|nr:hypothetical protein PIROE2DRAFT_66934 [Piromyces sp. E2]|eukprot:OUM68340.1 hypothetical protein PIROE2DRAFT_66934 [Piromyces sp. E2]